MVKNYEVLDFCLDQLKQRLGKLLVVSQQGVMVRMRGMGAIRPLHAHTHAAAGVHANITAAAGKHNAAAALQSSHGALKAADAGGAYVRGAHSAAPTTAAAHSTNIVRGGGTRTAAAA
jgi:hypothetical protein